MAHGSVLPGAGRFERRKIKLLHLGKRTGHAAICSGVPRVNLSPIAVGQTGQESPNWSGIQPWRSLMWAYLLHGELLPPSATPGTLRLAPEKRPGR